MNIFRKAYSVAGVVLMIQFVIQLYFIATTIFTIVFANDNAKDIYAAFKNADTFAGLHALNGDLIAVPILVMIGCSFGARYPRRTKILTATLFVLLVIQVVLAHTGVAVLSGLHGVNALVLIGLGGYLTGAHWAFRAGVEAKGSATS
ncbi:MAG: hypothetical protein NVS1B3_12110 [Candidatus Dormibacteraceae bacterium]